MRYRKIFRKFAVLNGSIAVITLVLSGCAGPPVLGRQVLGYDEVTKSLDQKLLLLNIARVDNGETVHFTSTSSIAASFDWTTTIGATGRLNSGSVADYLDLNIGASASENPTFSIVPISGETGGDAFRGERLRISCVPGRKDRPGDADHGGRDRGPDTERQFRPLHRK